MELWSWLLEGVGMCGVFLAGQKRWYAWCILLVNTVLWGVYAVRTRQYGFLLASFFYAPLYGRNAFHWKRGEVNE